MKYIFYLLFVFCVVTLFNSLHALETSDKEVIQQVISQMTEGWNHSSGKVFAEHYSEDASFVNIFGMLFSSKEEIAVRHDKIFDTFMKGSIFEVNDQQLREVQPGLVIAHVRWKVTNIPPSDKLLFRSTMDGIFTHVFVKSSENWNITFSQNTSMP